MTSAINVQQCIEVLKFGVPALLAALAAAAGPKDLRESDAAGFGSGWPLFWWEDGLLFGSTG